MPRSSIPHDEVSSSAHRSGANTTVTGKWRGCYIEDVIPYIDSRYRKGR